MANILRDVILHGTARSALSLGRNDIAGKTGTTNDAKDAWFAGFSPRMVAVSWVGFDNPSPLGRLEYGGYAALPIWTSFMQRALDGSPDEWLPPPAGMKAAASQPASANPSGNPEPPSDVASPDTPVDPANAPVQTAPEDLF